jgi:hypothetical protein
MSQSNPKPNDLDFVSGVLLVPLLRSLFLGLMIWLVKPVIEHSYPQTGNVLIFVTFGIGVSQLLYLIPIILFFQRRGRSEVIKGIFLGALLTIILNGSCFIVAGLVGLLNLFVIPILISLAVSTCILIMLVLKILKRR